MPDSISKLGDEIKKLRETLRARGRDQIVRNQGRRAIAVIIAAAILIYYANLYTKWQPTWVAPSALENGLLVLALVYAIYLAVTGDVAIWNAARGEDGRASTSKFQVLLWTTAVLFAYVAILGARWKLGATNVLPNLPQNVLIAMGLSVGTATAAAVVTASNASSGKEVKVPAKNRGLAPIFQSDDGQPDLGKIQLLAWTFVAVGVFLAAVLKVLADAGSAVTPVPPPASLPDIDPSLMVLTGLGSAAYIGNKLVASTTPYISARDKSEVSLLANAAGRTVTLTGVRFGTDPAKGQVVIDGVPLQDPIPNWTDTTIPFVVPPKKPDGSDWTKDTPLDVRVFVSGASSGNAVQVTLKQ